MSAPHHTLSSTAQRLRSKEYDPASAHRFASGSDQLLEDLQDLVNITSQISQSLDTFISLTSFTNPKLVSQLKQHSNISSSLHTLEHQTQSVLAGLNGKRLSLTRFGEDIPRDQTILPGWCISRIESYGAAAGLQQFKDEDASGKILLVLAGQVMVLDIVFQKGDKLEAVSVSTSYATQGDPASVSPLLDSLMLQLVRSFLAVTLHEDADPWKAARLGEVISAQFRDLFLLDSLASQQTNGGGSMWFTHTKTVDEIASELAKTEAQAVSSSLNATHASLDVFLLRSHALPLPFLASVFMSFLVHLSPRAYLQLKRSSSASDGPWDIPTSSLTSFLSAHPRPPGTVCAELKLVKRTQDAAADFHMGSTRPSISQDVPTDHTFPTVENYSWTLDFTGNGDPRKGVVTCQSRLKEIETVVHGSGLDVLPGASFGASSWVDLLLDSRGHFEHYTCEYTSPSSAHPPLHLRLANPAEPGFILERVPVKTMKDVWAVLEIVREQCWLNETLLCCSWTPESNDSFSEGIVQAVDRPSTEEATEDELQAILSGTLTPQKIPVNVLLSSASSLDSSMSGGITSAPKITMSFSMPSQTTSYVNMIDIPIVFKQTNTSGIEVDMGMMLGPQTDGFGEVCRRGGCFSLPGRVWMGRID